MKFEIEVRNVLTEKTHTETYTKNVEDPEAWAKETIDNFNRTIKPGEDIRELVSVKIIDRDAREPVQPPTWNDDCEDDGCDDFDEDFEEDDDDWRHTEGWDEDDDDE